MQATFQARPQLTDPQLAVFESWGALYGRVERELFAAHCAGDRDVKALDSKRPGTAS